MGNSLRCCLACVIPCGALDVIRIVHLNGQVEELTRPISAREVLDANPNYVLSKPSSQGVVRRILILSPNSELKRGNIYFLIPASSVPAEKKKSHNNNKQVNYSHKKDSISSPCSSHDIKKPKQKQMNNMITNTTTTTITTTTTSSTTAFNEVIPVPKSCERFLTETISEKKSVRRHRRRASSRASRDWRPHLESIFEDSKHFSSIGI